MPAVIGILMAYGEEVTAHGLDPCIRRFDPCCASLFRYDRIQGIYNNFFGRPFEIAGRNNTVSFDWLCEPEARPGGIHWVPACT